MTNPVRRHRSRAGPPQTSTRQAGPRGASWCLSGRSAWAQRVSSALDHATPGHGRQPGHPGQTSCHIRTDAGHNERKSVIASTRGPATATERPFGCGRIPPRLVHLALRRISRAVRPSSCDRLSRIGSARAGQVRSAAAPVPAEQEPSRRATQRHPASEPVILTWIPCRCLSSSTMMARPRTHVDRGREVPDDREFPARHLQSG